MYVLPGEEGAAGPAAGCGFRLLVAVCFPDPGGSVRKLVASFQCVAEHADCCFWSVCGSVAASHGSLGVSAELYGANRRGRLFANRLGDADRIGSEECDSDR